MKTKWTYQMKTKFGLTFFLVLFLAVNVSAQQFPSHEQLVDQQNIFFKISSLVQDILVTPLVITQGITAQGQRLYRVQVESRIGSGLVKNVKSFICQQDACVVFLYDFDASKTSGVGKLVSTKAFIRGVNGYVNVPSNAYYYELYGDNAGNVGLELRGSLCNTPEKRLVNKICDEVLVNPVIVSQLSNCGKYQYWSDKEHACVSGIKIIDNQGNVQVEGNVQTTTSASEISLLTKLIKQLNDQKKDDNVVIPEIKCPEDFDLVTQDANNFCKPRKIVCNQDFVLVNNECAQKPQEINANTFLIIGGLIIVFVTALFLIWRKK